MSDMMNRETVLSVEDLTINFRTINGMVKAVRGITFDLKRGETVAIVGESGSGKSVSIKAIMGILAGNAVVESGKIMYEGQNLLEIGEKDYHKIRGCKIGLIFQDPLSALNPIMKIGKQITETLKLNDPKMSKKEAEVQAAQEAEAAEAAKIQEIEAKKRQKEEKPGFFQKVLKFFLKKQEIEEPVSYEMDSYEEFYEASGTWFRHK